MTGIVGYNVVGIANSMTTSTGCRMNCDETASNTGTDGALGNEVYVAAPGDVVADVNFLVGDTSNCTVGIGVFDVTSGADSATLGTRYITKTINQGYGWVSVATNWVLTDGHKYAIAIADVSGGTFRCRTTYSGSAAIDNSSPGAVPSSFTYTAYGYTTSLYGTVDNVGTSGIAPTVVNTGTHDSSYVNGEDVGTIATSTWFDAGDGTGATYTISTGTLPTTLSINASSGDITGTLDSDASDAGPTFDLGVTLTTSVGSVEETFTFTINMQAKFLAANNQDIRLLDCSTTPAAETTATTSVLIYQAQNMADLVSQSPIHYETGLTISATGEVTITLDYPYVNRGDYFRAVLWDDTEGWQTPHILGQFV